MSVNVGVLDIVAANYIDCGKFAVVHISTRGGMGEASLHLPTIDGAKAVADAINKAVKK